MYLEHLSTSAGYQLFSHDELDTLTDKYGFKYEVVGGCVVNRWQQLAMDHYNEVVYQYQSQYFGLAWSAGRRNEIRIEK